MTSRKLNVDYDADSSSSSSSDDTVPEVETLLPEQLEQPIFWENGELLVDMRLTVNIGSERLTTMIEDFLANHPAPAQVNDDSDSSVDY